MKAFIAVATIALAVSIIFFQYGFDTNYYPLDLNRFSARLKNHL